MINAIIEFSARNRFVVFLIVAVAVVAGVWSMKTVPLDAIPDLSDTQVIVYSRWDRSPDIVEDQVTYPIVTAMLGAPKVKAVRGLSDFGFSYVYIVFDEGTDIYWARSRTMEYLSGVLPRLPQGVRTELGPDATGVGWVFQYALVDTTGRSSLAELRSYQDWYPPLLPEGGAGGRRSRAARWIRAAVPGAGRPEPPARVQHADCHGARRGARRQQRRRRTPGRNDRR
jgi:Cu(I)/Ag(I) efflux system membrane protein CusA/SilA